MGVWLVEVLAEEGVHGGGDGVGFFLQGEVAGVEQDDLGAGDVGAVGVRARGNEERVVAAPDGEDLGGTAAQPRMEFLVAGHDPKRLPDCI